MYAIRSYYAQRAGMEHLGPMAFNGIRFALGALALVPLAMRSAGARNNFV